MFEVALRYSWKGDPQILRQCQSWAHNLQFKGLAEGQRWDFIWNKISQELILDPIGTYCNSWFCFSFNVLLFVAFLLRLRRFWLLKFWTIPIFAGTAKQWIDFLTHVAVMFFAVPVWGKQMSYRHHGAAWSRTSTSLVQEKRCIRTFRFEATPSTTSLLVLFLQWTHFVWYSEGKCSCFFL